MNSWSTPQNAASCQWFDQPPQVPPTQPGVPHDSTHLNQAPPIMLPNNMVWQPQQDLFAVDQQHPPQQSQLHSSQNFDSIVDNTNSGLSSHWRALSSIPPFNTMQADPTPGQNSLEFSYNPLPTSIQDNNQVMEASIPTLMFDSSSSQPRSSPLDSPANYSPPPPFDTPGQQPQEHPLRPDIPPSWNYEPFQGDNKGQGDAGEDDRWEDWVDFGVHPDRESE
jgi:hypothetical protein